MIQMLMFDIYEKNKNTFSKKASGMIRSGFKIKNNRGLWMIFLGVRTVTMCNVVCLICVPAL
jgi:hypothetical protein